MLYGPETTRILKEDRFFKGNYNEVTVDTSLNNNYSPYFWFSDTTFQQTLSNLGLATKPLLYQFPERIGARLGRNVFDLYAFRPENVTYFNTRSPYSKLEFVQGTLGEGIFEGEFNRNIKPWWNAGIAYRRLASNKQLGSQRNQEEVIHNGLKLYTHLQSTNNKYHLFANFLNNNHKFVETGGVKVGRKRNKKYLFDFLNDTINLTQATGREIRNSFHVGQTYALFGETLKLFYNLDNRTQRNYFVNTAVDLERNREFYLNRVYYDSLETRDKTIYSELENTAGITGNQKHFYYTAYLKNRNAKYQYLTHETADELKKNQTFVGGEGELKVNERIKTSFRGEYKIAGEYFAQATLELLFFGVQQTRISYAPSFMQQAYFGNHHRWQNEFDNISADRSAAWVSGTLFKNYLRLEVANTSVRNYVYYNQDQVSAQASGVQRLQTVVLDHKFDPGKFHWENLISYTNTSANSVIRVPEWAIRSRVFYEGFILKKALFGQIGLEANYRSSYLADAYAPAIQQFYTQDLFTVENYPVIDFFIAADIKSLNVFLKLAHANEGLNGPGYFSTPYYPGMRRSFIFGIKWQFFD